MTGAEIVEELEIATSTVSAVLEAARARQALAGWSHPSRSAATSSAAPGELIHIDVKKLGRIGAHGAGQRFTGRSRRHDTASRTDAAGVRRRQVGWECVHVCVDDATRLAYAEVLARRAGDDRDRLPAASRSPSTARTGSRSSG